MQNTASNSTCPTPRVLERRGYLSVTCLLATLIVTTGCDTPNVSSDRNEHIEDQPSPTSAAFVDFGSSGESTPAKDYYAKCVHELEPAIRFIDGHIAQHGKLPTPRAFQEWADEVGAHMLIIRDRNHDYAAKHGAKSDTDYLVGTWRGEWYFYYKSWDGNFIEASDELH